MFSALIMFMQIRDDQIRDQDFCIRSSISTNIVRKKSGSTIVDSMLNYIRERDLQRVTLSFLGNTIGRINKVIDKVGTN